MCTICRQWWLATRLQQAHSRPLLAHGPTRRSACLTEQDYVNLVKQGFDSPEALLDARDKSLEAINILVRQGAVDAVLAWQAESKPKQHLGKWQCVSWVIVILISHAGIAHLWRKCLELCDRKICVCKLGFAAHIQISWKLVILHVVCLCA